MRWFTIRTAMWMVLGVALTLSAVRCGQSYFGTIFAPGVQRHLFDSRLIGMTEAEVLAVHGTPLFTRPGYGGWETWYYSIQSHAHTVYYFRMELSVDSKTSRVVSFFHQFYLD